jgi:hypothetical protein
MKTGTFYTAYLPQLELLPLPVVRDLHFQPGRSTRSPSSIAGTGPVSGPSRRTSPALLILGREPRKSFKLLKLCCLHRPQKSSTSGLSCRRLLAIYMKTKHIEPSRIREGTLCNQRSVAGDSGFQMLKCVALHSYKIDYSGFLGAEKGA